MVKLVDSSRWEPLIGRLFIAFGSIERTTHQCIRDWAGSNIHKHFVRAGLSVRIDLAIDLTAAQEASEATKDVYCKSLQQAKQLAKYRNLVAHNPLCLVLLQDELEGSFLEAIAHSTDDNKFLSFDELLSIVEEAEQLAEDITHNFVAFRIEKLEFESLKSFPGLGKPQKT
ncbi:hypothetical protein [uncultured Amphritea sp.]|uniref:hypothetical protein n=1 Tax=uncultured Amphritea sp. TaxID=981605 RepID=UPI0025D37680|nr:hypothetical protein [uncultured Amphritea sp.]